MTNLETLKQELLNQKSAIEEKGGSVVVANTNPSPSEITTGIKNIPMADLTSSTATEEDVVQGKTFYSGSSELKVGTYQDPTDKYNHLFCYNSGEQTSETEYAYSIPSNLSAVKYYAFAQNYNNISIYFHSDLETLGSYAFYETPNFKFYNFADMSNLKEIKTYGFANSNAGNINLEEIPSNVEELGNRAFLNMPTEGCSINIPTNLTALDAFCFACDTFTECKNFNMSVNTPIKTLSASTLQNLSFDCDLIVPTTVTSIASKFNYNGSFNNVTIGENVTSLATNCFNADSTMALSDIKLKTVTFTRTTPPTISASSFSSQAVENGLKIYVPDESYEEYLAKLTNYTNCVHPVSEKE